VPLLRSLTALPIIGLASAFALAGCGFVDAGTKSSVKPASFVISGTASVALTAPGVPGAACTAPAGASDVAADAAVIVTNPAGTRLAGGHLGQGIVTGDGSACAFPFQIRAVTGGFPEYGVAVGTRPAKLFQAAALRANQPADLTITPSP
jgi:hypothetical protein